MIGMSPSAWRREQEMSGVDNMSLGMAAPDRGLQGVGPRMGQRREEFVANLSSKTQLPSVADNDWGEQ